MNDLCQFVGVTYGEFQSWYNYGEIRLGVDRLTSIEVCPDTGIPNKESPYIQILLGRIPQLNLEDQEGIVLIQLKPGTDDQKQGKLGAIDPGITQVSIERVKCVIPLNQRARRILDPRVSPLGIELTEPYFQEQVELQFARLRTLSDLRAGDALIETFFENASNCITPTLRNGAKNAILAVARKQSKESVTTVIENVLIFLAFDFSRYEPYDSGSIDFLIDAGLLLKDLMEQLEEDESIIGPYRKLVEALRREVGKDASLYQLLGDPRLKKVSSELNKSFSKGSPPAGLTSIIIFLWWKENYRRNRSAIDYDGIASSVPKFVESAGFNPTVIALWLLGCQAGYADVGPTLYASKTETYTWFSEKKARNIEKQCKPEEQKHSCQNQSPEIVKSEVDNPATENLDTSSSVDNPKLVSIKRPSTTTLRDSSSKEGELASKVSRANEKQKGSKKSVEGKVGNCEEKTEVDTSSSNTVNRTGIEQQSLITVDSKPSANNDSK